MSREYTCGAVLWHHSVVIIQIKKLMKSYVSFMTKLINVKNRWESVWTRKYIYYSCSEVITFEDILLDQNKARSNLIRCQSNRPYATPTQLSTRTYFGMHWPGHIGICCQWPGDYNGGDEDEKMVITVITATTWMMTGPQLITICIDQAILVTSRRWQ